MNAILKYIAYEKGLKPLLFQLQPETAHEFAASSLKIAEGLPLFKHAIKSILDYHHPILETEVSGIKFPNPVGMAAGFDKTAELYPMLSYMGFGHIEIGTITKFAQAGNEPPRLFRFPEKEALINRMGFNNPGADQAMQTIQAQKKIAIRGVNAGKSKITPLEDSIQDYSYTFKKLLPFCDYAVMNVSSPNTPGLRSLQSVKELEKLVIGVKQEIGGVFPKPFFLKFAPDLAFEDLDANLEALPDWGIQGVILTNTTLDKSIFPNPPEGGLSGFPLFEKSLSYVRHSYKILRGKIPIVGVGGITSPQRAEAMIRAGANLIQIYTGYIFNGPFFPSEICKHLQKVLSKEGLLSLSDLVGSDH